MIICGIHGTSHLCAAQIKAQGFKPGNSGQLGAACYFFPCDPAGHALAIRWASSSRGKKLAPLPGEPVALAAKISIADGLIDLTSDNLRIEIQKAWHAIKSKYGYDQLLCEKAMRSYLNGLYKEQAAKDDIDIENCVILSPYPPFDGGSFRPDSICYAVKGNGANIILCPAGRAHV